MQLRRMARDCLVGKCPRRGRVDHPEIAERGEASQVIDQRRALGRQHLLIERRRRGFALATFRLAYDEGVAAARTALGPTEFDAAWTLGRSLTLDDALNEALT